MPKTKKCPSCEKRKVLAKFPPHKGKAHGRATWCRECTNAGGRDWYARNAKKHKEQTTAARRARVAAGSTKERDASRQRRKDYSGEPAFELGRRLSDAKKRAKKKGLTATITTGYLVAMWEAQDSKCALTGWRMTFCGGLTDPHCASIDRIDNSKGYIDGNVRLICWMVNKALSAWGQPKFVSMCRDVLGVVDAEGARGH